MITQLLGSESQNYEICQPIIATEILHLRIATQSVSIRIATHREFVSESC